MFKLISKIILTTLLPIILCLAIADLLLHQPISRNETYSPTQGNTISILLLDGLSKSIFETNLKAGKLPNIEKLIQTGTYIKNGIGSFPSMTGYAFYPFITGKDAAESGIYGLRWFNRSLDKGNLRNYVGRTNIYMNEDIHPTPKNIFELSDDQYTCSINSYMNKGVKQSEMTGWKHTTSKYEHHPLFRWLRSMPFFGKRLTADFFEHETYTMQLAKKQLEKNPKVQWVTLPSLDAMNHIHGTTPAYTALLCHIDSLIGGFVKTINDLGQGNTRALAIVTDHGISDVQKNLDLRKNFQDSLGLAIERGKSVHLWTNQLTKPLERLKDKDGFLVINGNLSAYLYFRDPSLADWTKNWRKKLVLSQLRTYPSPKKGSSNLLNFLAQQEGIGLLACQQNDSSVWVQLYDQTAVITKQSSGFRYQLINGDPLGYSSDTLAVILMDNQFHTADEWLQHTLNTEYPDAIYRLYQLMSKPDVGDLLICSQKGYDLASDYELFVKNYKGGHGGLHRDLLQVPYILNFPNKNAQQIKVARSEAVGKMIKEYLGW